MPSKRQYEEAYQIITDLGQEKLFDRNIFELSSGEMQIVKLGRAIIQKPKVILFDEPTSNLDIKNQLMVAGIKKRLHKTVSKSSKKLIGKIKIGNRLIPDFCLVNS